MTELVIEAISVRATETLTAATTTSRVSANGAQLVRILNLSGQVIFVAFGSSTVVATVAAGFPIANGTSEIVDIGGNTHVAAITATGTGAAYVTALAN